MLVVQQRAGQKVRCGVKAPEALDAQAQAAAGAAKFEERETVDRQLGERAVAGRQEPGFAGYGAYGPYGGLGYGGMGMGYGYGGIPYGVGYGASGYSAYGYSAYGYGGYGYGGPGVYSPAFAYGGFVAGY